MFSTKKLTEEQINTIKDWATQGERLAGIQRRMREEMEISLTYMETRFVVLDLGITLEEDKPEEPIAQIVQPIVPTGKTTVTMDSLALPGAIVSGRVEFSDGESGIWMLDQMGRPSLDLNTPSYEPTEEDILEFQKQLRSLIQSTGL